MEKIKETKSIEKGNIVTPIKDFSRIGYIHGETELKVDEIKGDKCDLTKINGPGPKTIINCPTELLELFKKN